MRKKVKTIAPPPTGTGIGARMQSGGIVIINKANVTKPKPKGKGK